MVVEIVTSMANSNIQLSRANIIDLARSLALKDATWTGDGWCEKFIGRHPEVSTAMKLKPISDGRIDQTTLRETTIWLAAYQELLRRVHIINGGSNLYNMDETLMSVRADQVMFHRVSPKGSSKNYSAPKFETYGSCTAFLSADGQTLFHVFVFRKPKGRNVLEDEAHLKLKMIGEQRAREGGFPLFYMANESGRVDGQIFEQMMIKFCELASQKNNVASVLLMDNLGAHLDTAAIIALHKAGHFICYLPKNTTHFLQPLDGAYFGAWRAALVSIMRNFALAHSVFGISQRDAMFLGLQKATDAVANVALGQASWKQRGLYPFNPTLILELAQKNVNVTNDATMSWVAKIVNNVVREVVVRTAEEIEVEASAMESVDIVVKKNVMYSSFDVIDHKRRVEAAVAKKVADAAKKKAEAKEQKAKKLADQVAAKALKEKTKAEKLEQKLKDDEAKTTKRAQEKAARALAKEAKRKAALKKRRDAANAASKKAKSQKAAVVATAAAAAAPLSKKRSSAVTDASSAKKRRQK